jgi:hypothetical protein
VDDLTGRCTVVGKSKVGVKVLVSISMLARTNSHDSIEGLDLIYCSIYSARLLLRC